MLVVGSIELLRRRKVTRRVNVYPFVQSFVLSDIADVEFVASLLDNFR